MVEKKTRTIIRFIGKSIRFPLPLMERVERIAKRLGYTRLVNGTQTGNISRVTLDMIEYCIQNERLFIEWRMMNGGNEGEETA
jgi:hypothetical protein